MRGLSELELRGLTNLTGPDEIVRHDDPMEEAWTACVERGLATCRVENRWRHWDINNLGRLALRVHYAATKGS